jgi:hypothetical protein
MGVATTCNRPAALPPAAGRESRVGIVGSFRVVMESSITSRGVHYNPRSTPQVFAA